MGKDMYRKALIGLFMISFLPGFRTKDCVTVEVAPIKAVVFDFDGTLVDSLPFAIAKINSFAHEYGFAPINDIQKIRCKSLERVIKEDLNLAFYQLPGFAKRLRNHVSEQEVNSIKAFAGIKEVLEQLQKHYLVGVVTSNFPDIVQCVLANAGVKGVHFIYADSSLFGKHVVLNHMLKEHHLSPDEVIYVGDEVRDVQACKKAGIKMIAVSWGFNTHELLQKEQPFKLVDTPEQLLASLKNYV